MSITAEPAPQVDSEQWLPLAEMAPEDRMSPETWRFDAPFLTPAPPETVAAESLQVTARRAGEAAERRAPAAQPAEVGSERAEWRPASLAASPAPPLSLGQTSPARPTYHPQPQYPEASKLAGEQGEVMLRIDLNERGEVTAVRVLTSSGHSRLDDAALAKVRDWRFEPATQDGIAIPWATRQPIVFVLPPR